VALHGRVAGKSAAAWLARSRVPGKLTEARAAVKKAATRTQALAAMDAALKSKSADGVYAARDELVARYAELSEDPPLLERMNAASALIRGAVVVDPSRRPAESEPRPDLLGPPTSLVLRLAPKEPVKGATPRAASGTLVFALAEGLAVGLEATTGAPLWQVPVGLSSPFHPRPIPGGGGLLAFYARTNDLVRLDARTGSLVWRQPIGEPVIDPPLVLGNQILQATPGGKLILFDLASGEVRSTVNLGKPLARPPVSDEAGQFLYVLADKDCLFVLARDPLACAGVEYLGHATGSVACPPARIGRFLVIAENTTISDGRWHIFVIGENGTRLRKVQQVAVDGWTWSTPASSGSILWATGDRGNAAAYAIGTYDSKDPFRVVARTNPDPKSSGPAYAIARSEHEIWINSGRSGRFELDAERGKIESSWTLGEAGVALAPPQVAGDLLVLTQQSTEGTGVALWAVEPHSGSVRWRTVLGAPWRVPLESASGDDAFTTLADDGRPVSIGRDRIDAGGFIEVPLPRPGEKRFAIGPLRRIEADGLTLLVPGRPADHLLVRSGTDATTFDRIELPAPVAAMPLLWGREVVVPGTDGRIDLLDARTGGPRAEPYIAPFDRSHPTRWRAPVRLGGDAIGIADESGKVRRLTRTADPAPRLIVSAEVNLGNELAADPLATENAMVLVTLDGRIRALAARDLSPVGAWPLDGPLATPPATVAGRGFLADVAGNVHAFGPDGLRLWSTRLSDGVAAGPPVVTGDSVWFLTRSGSLRRHDLGDGTSLDRIDLDILPAGNLRSIASQIVLPVGPGTLRTLKSHP
jgi:outer membrane protein assembly factor BamB